ncbi:HNH/ENDO VII family nuclease [Lutibacter sp.]|uniref:HNH/ENDO VII family nuclease n=1 Tax=Lutibacter sp. TaxID=1925666 RepID=UPI0035682DFE
MEEGLNNNDVSVEKIEASSDIENTNTIDRKSSIDNLENNVDENLKPTQVQENDNVFVDEFPGEKNIEKDKVENNDTIFVDEFPNQNFSEGEDLTKSEISDMIEKTGYSRETVEQMKSPEEANIYTNAGLEEKDVNGRTCLTRTDIDSNLTDEFGRSNKSRMESGLSPIDKEGNSIQLHHIGQKNDGGLAELTGKEHGVGKGNENYDILHDRKKESDINREDFKSTRQNHWKSRAQDYK